MGGLMVHFNASRGLFLGSEMAAGQNVLQMMIILIPGTGISPMLLLLLQGPI